MYHKHQTKGIVLSSKAEGSDSRRIIVLTKDFGLLSAKVQGARQTPSKLRSGSQDFCIGEFSFVHGKSGWKVVSVNTEKNIFETFRTEPEKMVVALNVLKLVKKLVFEDHGEPKLFEIVSNFLDFLILAPKQDILALECLVLLKILHCLGYMREDLETNLSLGAIEIDDLALALVAPKRREMVRLINESLKATNLT